ncbi:rho guanine nucleotide exchange factor 11 isoform X2 [Myxocyprinus asiaticus]|uniref:rho guanine nucleotide exchange factor 11 isoform X2 n=1 Tax=Myxocyprinus asiaticus TaxID=70543 RepID=UPI0022233D22|nr:rho guanine nucleotide exchange factor 11 isoform X2 [Myxocyprinus asiaticus]
MDRDYGSLLSTLKRRQLTADELRFIAEEDMVHEGMSTQEEDLLDQKLLQEDPDHEEMEGEMEPDPQPRPSTGLSSLTLGDSERRSSLGQERETLPDLPSESTGLVQRCVVVQRDNLGFGFTVCGERIKLVQNVRPGGAAIKAGVHEGDRIIKVNGSLVSSMSHQEVVKMIKSGTYVALTLQGPPPLAASVPLQPLPTDLLPNHRTALGVEALPPPLTPPTGSSTPTQRITGPKPLQDPEVQKHATEILRKMLEQEEAELQNLLAEQFRNPSSSLEERIGSAKRRANQVRVKIQQDVHGTRSEAIANYFTAGEGRLSVDSSEGDVEACESPFSSPSTFLQNPLQHRQGSDINTSDLGGKAQIIGPEEEDDDEYTINEMHGPFQDIELLKSRPAHMTVFIRYVFSQQLDPNPLLFYLSVEAYLSSSPKDARSLASQICSHFLDHDAPLKIEVREEFLTDIESRLHAQEDIRGPLSELQQQVLPDIQDQLQDYRNKQMMGLGSLFGESELQQLDGDPVKERQVVDKQVIALWEVLSKHDEDRSSPLASAVHLYLRHSGIKLRDSKVFPGLISEKEKWLLFFPKTKKLSSAKREKDGEDKKRNPILKYIGKPKCTSQSIRPGSVQNIIQQFENHSDSVEDRETEGQSLSSSSFGEDSMDSPTISVRLARSESLKAQGEGRRHEGGTGVESVPRSRSDVDMEDCEEREGPGLRPLHHSTSSVSSSSARSLENPTPPYTPRSRRRSVDSPVPLLPDAPALEEDVIDSHNWQETVEPHILMSLSSREIDRQAVIYELFTTEASHLRTLRVLDQVFFQKMQNILSPEELSCIFLNLRQVYELHATLCESMRKRRESVIVHGIGDIMLARFEDEAGDQFQEQVSHLCSQQSRALELIRSKQRKDPRFAHLIQECEASPHCRRLQLKDLLVSEMQRLTKYPLLLDNIIKHTEVGSADLQLLQRAQVCCRGILQAVNEVVRETEHRDRLSQYQRRLDLTPLERQTNPVAAQFKNLNLTTKRMIHEGPLTWKVSKDKAIEIQALLLSDLLVLLQRGPDDRLILRCPSRSLGGVGGGATDLKAPFCPVVRLDSLLIRSVATDNKALYVISTSESQIYELVAGTSSEKNTWKDLLEKTIALATQGAGEAKQGSLAPSSGGRSSANQLHISLSEESVSLEKDSADDDEDECALTPTTPTDESEVCNDEDKDGYLEAKAGVAEAALQDVENLRQLIFRDLEDGRSQDSDDTPTNETANERSSFSDRVEPEVSEPALSERPSQWVEEHVEVVQPTVQVVRKVVGAGSSIPDDITDDVTSSQSSMEKGNMFYLVMPKDQNGALTDESSTDAIKDSDTSQNHHQTQSVFLSSFIGEEEQQETPCLSPTDQSLTENLSQEEGLGQSQANIQRHVIKHVDEIFHTIEELMRKLQHLRDIEADHYKLLKKLRKPLSVDKGSSDLFYKSPTAVGIPSMHRGAGDGKEGVSEEPSQPEIQSTGF